MRHRPAEAPVKKNDGAREPKKKAPVLQLRPKSGASDLEEGMAALARLLQEPWAARRKRKTA